MPRREMVDVAIAVLMHTDLIGVIFSLLPDDVCALGRCAAVCVGWRDAARLEARARLDGWAAQTKTLDIPSFAPLVCSMVGAMALSKHRSGTFCRDNPEDGSVVDRIIASKLPHYNGSMVEKLAWRFTFIPVEMHDILAGESFGADHLCSHDGDSDGLGAAAAATESAESIKTTLHAAIHNEFFNEEAKLRRFLNVYGDASHEPTFDTDVRAALELLLGGIRYSKHESNNLARNAKYNVPPECADGDYIPASQARVIASHLSDVWFQHVGAQGVMNRAAREKSAAAPRRSKRAEMRGDKEANTAEELKTLYAGSSQHWHRNGELCIPHVKMCHLRAALANYSRARANPVAKQIWHTSPMETQILKLCGDLAPLVRQHFATTLPQSDYQWEMHRYQLTMYHGADYERKVRAAYKLARDAYALALEGDAEEDAEEDADYVPSDADDGEW